MSLPVYRGSADHLRNGFRSLDCENRASHPIAEMQRKVSLILIYFYFYFHIPFLIFMCISNF